ncbi:MAG: ABC transporter permease [Gemmatimonadetes bacterium]|nr:ABC transporter permease [Gemmatimonadota bacterium]
MLWKEFVQMRRDRFTLAMMIGIPMIQIALFGYAIQTEVRHLPMVVVDESRSPQSRALIRALTSTGYFDLEAHLEDREEVRRWVERGDAAAAVIIPPDFAKDLKRRREATAQVIIDAADPLSPSAAIAASGQIAALQTRQMVVQAAGPQGLPSVDVRVRPWYNPALKSSVYIVPGIIGVLLSMTMVIVASIAVVRERERGTLEQLIVTPINKTSLMLGKIVPFLVVGYVQMTVILLVGRLLFGVPISGSLVDLYLGALPFIVASLGVGLLVSTAVTTQAQAMQLGFFYLLPNILLSGFMFPRAAMPEPAQWIGAALPLTYFLLVLRGILLKGVDLGTLAPEVATLTGFSVVLIALAVRRFNKRIDG